MKSPLLLNLLKIGQEISVREYVSALFLIYVSKV